MVPARGATMSPPIGPVLGQYGINIMEFCKQFNEKSKEYPEGVLLTVLIFQFMDKTFTFQIKNLVNSFLLKDLLTTKHDTDTKLLKFNNISVKDLYVLSKVNASFYGCSEQNSLKNLIAIMDSCGLVLTEKN